MAFTRKFISAQQDEYPHAYIVADSVTCRKKDTDVALFQTYKSVEARNAGLPPVEQIYVSFKYDKTSVFDLYKQAYIAAKATEEFSNCEDLI